MHVDRVWKSHSWWCLLQVAQLSSSLDLRNCKPSMATCPKMWLPTLLSISINLENYFWVAISTWVLYYLDTLQAGEFGYNYGGFGLRSVIHCPNRTSGGTSRGFLLPLNSSNCYSHSFVLQAMKIVWHWNTMKYFLQWWSQCNSFLPHEICTSGR